MLATHCFEILLSFLFRARILASLQSISLDHILKHQIFTCQESVMKGCYLTFRPWQIRLISVSMQYFRDSTHSLHVSLPPLFLSYLDLWVLDWTFKPCG